MSKSSRAKVAAREADPKARETAEQLATALEQVPDGRQDEWLDLAVAALDETQGDVPRAIALANACLREGVDIKNGLPHVPEDKLP